MITAFKAESLSLFFRYTILGGRLNSSLVIFNSLCEYLKQGKSSFESCITNLPIYNQTIVYLTDYSFLKAFEKTFHVSSLGHIKVYKYHTYRKKKRFYFFPYLLHMPLVSNLAHLELLVVELRTSRDSFLWKMGSEVLSLAIVMWAFWALVPFQHNGETFAYMSDCNTSLCYFTHYVFYGISLILRCHWLQVSLVN